MSIKSLTLLRSRNGQWKYSTTEVQCLSVAWLVAFSAGMVSAFNPCGIGLLPSYLVYLLSGRIDPSQWKWYSGTLAGLLMTIGFVLVFGLAGSLLGSLGHLIFSIVPVVSLLVAVALLITSILMWRGTLSVKWSLGGVVTRVERIFRRGSYVSFVAYGISYGLISLTCSLPVFLAVVAEGLSSGLRGMTMLFGAFALGMGVVVVLLSTLATLARTFVERFIHGAIPAVQKLSAVVMAASGMYLVWYWVWGPGIRTVFLK